MPEVSFVIEDMLSKANINIYVVAATRRADRVPRGNNSLSQISLASQLLISEEKPQNNSFVDQ